MITGYSYPGLGCFSLYSEISSIFLTYNDMLKTKGHSPLAMYNQIVFFITYTVTRMISFPWILFQMCRTLYLFFGLVPIIRKIGMLICCLQAVLILALNMFWYRVIVKKIIRIAASGKAQNDN